MVYALAGMAFLAPLKFGTPVVLRSVLPAPMAVIEWIFFSWPNQLGAILCFGTMIWFAADRRRWPMRVDWLAILPVLFLTTQSIAVWGSINWLVSTDTLMHFAVCVLLFYVASSYVRDGAAVEKIFAGLGLASFLVCSFAMEQWWTGLEDTRQMVAAMGPQNNMPPELLARMQSNRIFSTLVYPNALAGYLVVAFAPVLAWIWVRGRIWDRRTKWATVTLVGAVMLFCLVLTGSRGGFVAFIAAAVTGLWFCGGRTRNRWVVGLIIGLAGIFALGLFGGFIRLTGTSLDARFHYWRGAVRIIQDHPIRGTGPGTFGSIYPSYRTGGTEEPQMAHNNFLQMWTDSGLIGFCLFSVLSVIALRDAARLVDQRPGDAAAVAISAAMVGWTVHGLVDFDLYVPGVAFPAFILLGSLQGLKPVPVGRETSLLARIPRVGLGLAAVVVAGVIWHEGRSLAADFAHARAHYLTERNPLGALTAIQRAITLAPGNGHYASSAADLAWLVGRRDQAIAFSEEAINDDPYRASFHWRLAHMLGPTPDGMHHVRRAFELNPMKKEYRDAVAAFDESVRQGQYPLIESAPTNR